MRSGAVRIPHSRGMGKLCGAFLVADKTHLTGFVAHPHPGESLKLKNVLSRLLAQIRFAVRHPGIFCGVSGRIGHSCATGWQGRGILVMGWADMDRSGKTP